MDEDKCFFSELILDFFKYDLVYSYLDYRYEESALICKCFKVEQRRESEDILNSEIDYNVYSLITFLEEFLEILMQDPCLQRGKKDQINFLIENLPDEIELYFFNPLLNIKHFINLKIMHNQFRKNQKIASLKYIGFLQKYLTCVYCPYFYIFFFGVMYKYTERKYLMRMTLKAGDMEFLEHINKYLCTQYCMAKDFCLNRCIFTYSTDSGIQLNSLFPKIMAFLEKHPKIHDLFLIGIFKNYQRTYQVIAREMKLKDSSLESLKNVLKTDIYNCCESELI